jgi:hypothetical protein
MESLQFDQAAKQARLAWWGTEHDEKTKHMKQMLALKMALSLGRKDVMRHVVLRRNCPLRCLVARL